MPYKLCCGGAHAHTIEFALTAILLSVTFSLLQHHLLSSGSGFNDSFLPPFLCLVLGNMLGYPKKLYM